MSSPASRYRISELSATGLYCSYASEVYVSSATSSNHMFENYALLSDSYHQWIIFLIIIIKPSSTIMNSQIKCLEGPLWIPKSWRLCHSQSCSGVCLTPSFPFRSTVGRASSPSSYQPVARLRIQFCKSSFHNSNWKIMLSYLPWKTVYLKAKFAYFRRVSTTSGLRHRDS